MLFFEDGTHKMLVTIEVKLNSSMSNTEERDQLAAYAMILGKRNEVGLDSFRPIIYLTPHSSLTEIRRSTDTYRRKTRNGASADLYSLEWQDVAEVAQSFVGQSVPDLLSEVAEFLSRRGLIRFRGFHSPDSNVCGRFYRRRYFNSQTRTVVGNLGGRFYAN
jgi:hypothetical protein